MINCNKCGASLNDGIVLTRVNPYGEKGVWECSPICGTKFDKEDLKILHALDIATELNEQSKENK